MNRWRNVSMALKWRSLSPWRRLAKAALMVVPFGILRGGRYRHKVRHMLKSQWWSLDEIRADQFRKIRDLVEYACAHCTFYAKKYREVGFLPGDMKSWEDFHNLPLTTKEDLRVFAQEVKSDQFDSIKSRSGSTGASTGKGLAFHLDCNVFEWEWAAMARQYTWTGVYHANDPYAVLRGPLGKDSGIAYLCPLWKNLFINTENLNDQTLSKITDQIVCYQPVAIGGYPSVLELLCRCLQERGDNRIRPKVVFVNSEPLYDHQRGMFERVFGCKVFESYGLSDHCVSAMECDQGSMHVNPEYTYTELIDTDPRTGCGELVGTSLYSRAFPFIRYHTDDFAQWGQPCACGRALPCIKSIVGRHGDFLVASDGSLVSPTVVAFCTVDVDAIAVQYHQKAHGQLTIRIVPKSSFGDADQVKLLSQARRFLGEGTCVTIEVVGSLPRTPRGKTRFVICDIKS